MSLETKLRKLREQKNWSQMDIAHQLDISQSAYNKWESGQSKPTLNNLQKLAEIFEVDFFDLIKEQIPHADFSNSKFEGNSYVVNPIDSTNNFQSNEVIEKIIANQSSISSLIETQNKLIETLINKT